MNENTAYPDSTCSPNCQPESDEQKAKNKHDEEVRRANQQKMKDEDKDRNSADKKAERTQGQHA
uniref:hypothetical protein n=1 Tax=Candidatus Electronema sp. TaxID=2698783 RepID=UPI0040570BAD